MDGQNLWEMEWSGYENLLQEDEVFSFQHELPPLDFWYPESSDINYDLDATYLIDNISETPIQSSMDILPDPTVVYEGDISAGQDGEFGFPDQGFATMNSLNFPDQGIPETNFSSLLTQGMNSLNFHSQEMSGTSFLSFPTPELNSLIFPIQGLSMMDTLSFPTQGLNSLSHSSQELPMIDVLSFPTPEPSVNAFEFTNQIMSVMDTLSFPTQETYIDTLEFPNQELFMMNSLSFPAQEMTSLDFSNQRMYMDTLEFPHQELSMLDALNLPAQGMSSLEFPNQEPCMNTSEFPYQTQPMFMTMEDIRETEDTNMVSSSGSEQSQEELDPNDGNGNGNGGYESNLPLRLTLSREMISQYFHMSIIDAAKALNVGTTLLKRRCRELGINRCPQRKFKSLQTIITYLQGMESKRMCKKQSSDWRMRKKQMEETPDLQLEDDTIRLRQVCYKATHKKRKQSDRDH